MGAGRRVWPRRSHRLLEPAAGGEIAQPGPVEARRVGPRGGLDPHAPTHDEPPPQVGTATLCRAASPRPSNSWCSGPCADGSTATVTRRSSSTITTSGTGGAPGTPPRHVSPSASLSDPGPSLDDEGAPSGLDDPRGATESPRRPGGTDGRAPGGAASAPGRTAARSFEHDGTVTGSGPVGLAAHSRRRARARPTGPRGDRPRGDEAGHGGRANRVPGRAAGKRRPDPPDVCITGRCAPPRRTSPADSVSRRAGWR